MAPTVARINLFPMKSCDGHSQNDSIVAPTGNLLHDRQFALVDSDGKFINAKRTPLIHRILLQIDPVRREFRVGRRNAAATEIEGHLDRDSELLSDWLSDFFALEVSIVENREIGFPDDSISSGPTVISTATLNTVASWFDGLTVDEVRRRFRANVEIDGVDPFWEDQLYRVNLEPQPFRIGGVTFGGTNPCQRCVVPTRESLTGELVPTAFAKHFSRLRDETLPLWATRERFDHFYRLSTNTRLLDHGRGMICVGDPVEILSPR